MPILYAKVSGTWTPINFATPPEVSIGTTVPAGNETMWIDTSTAPPTTKAFVSGAWVTVGAIAPDEVWVGPSDPMPANPKVELWFDSDAPPSVAPGVGLPLGGTVGQVLQKLSSTPFDAGWVSTFGTEALKPATPTTPTRYFATDTKRDWLCDGTGWIIVSEPQQAWTPAWANVTLGTGGTSTGYTHRADGFVDLSATLVLGSSGQAMGVNPYLTLPFLAANLRPNQFTINLNDSTALYTGINQAGQASAGTTITVIYAVRADARNISYDSIGPTIPFTWGPGDGIEVTGRFQMASRYS